MFANVVISASSTHWTERSVDKMRKRSSLLQFTFFFSFFLFDCLYNQYLLAICICDWLNCVVYIYIHIYTYILYVYIHTIYKYIVYIYTIFAYCMYIYIQYVLLQYLICLKKIGQLDTN